MMLNKQAIKRNTIRHALSMSFAMLLAVAVNFFFTFSQAYWIPLAAFITCQMSRHTPLRQGLIYFFIMITALVIAVVLKVIMPAFLLVPISFLLFFIFFQYFLYQIKLDFQKKYFYSLIFFIVFLIIILKSSFLFLDIRNIILDITIGIFLGVLSQLFIFPFQIDVEFSQGVIPILTFLRDHSIALMKYLDSPTDQALRASGRTAILLQDLYPEWVYAVGFNRGLRAGLRFFLIKLEQITEIFCSMQYLASQPIEPSFLNHIKMYFDEVMAKNRELLLHLIEYFENKKYTVFNSDYTSDVVQLEQALQNVLPKHLELIDISSNYLLLITWVRDMKDLRQILLQLVMSLSATISSGRVE